MKIKTSPEDDDALTIEAETFREARLLALTFQRLSVLHSMAQDAHVIPDRVWLEDTGKTLALVWTLPEIEDTDQ